MDIIDVTNSEWVVCVRRSERKKMNLPLKIFLWMFGILVLLAIIAVIYVAAKIFLLQGIKYIILLIAVIQH